jgi:tetratricopeptide (TPR) repeat protein
MTAHEAQLTEMADRARILARDIRIHVGRILAALQIGDVSRQRAVHVQSGLALLDNLDPSASRLRLRAAGELLLAAQLEAALRDYTHEVSKLLPSIEGLASGALALAALSDLMTELGDGDDALCDLKRRIDAAVQLVAEIQASDSAARYLAGRLANENGGSPETSDAGVERHPLDQKASELLDRITYLEAAADDCVVILERLKEASEALITDRQATVQASSSAPESQKELAGAAERIKAILDKAEGDMAAHAGQSTDILRLVDRAASPVVLHEPQGGLDLGSYGSLKFASPDLGPDEDAFSAKLSVLLSKIERLYVMGQERDVHRAFSKACGLQVVEPPEEMEDGLF